MPPQITAFRVWNVFLWVGMAVILTGREPAAHAAHELAGPLDVELEDLRPGLLATYRSLSDKNSTLSRIDPKPSFYLGQAKEWRSS